MYYLRSFSLDLSLQIQNSSATTFSKVYRQVVFAKAYLILVGKLPHHMLMPYFLMLPHNHVLRSQAINMDPPLASIFTPIQS